MTAPSFLVIGVNQDEFGRGNARPVEHFKTEAEMIAYVMRYNGNAALLEAYRVERLTVSVKVEPA